MATKKTPQDSPQLNPERGDEIMRRAFAMPPKPNKQLKPKKRGKRLSQSAKASRSAPPLSVSVDRNKLYEILEHAAASCPDLLDEFLCVIADKNAGCKPSALFDYAFVVADGEARRADNPIVGFRLRDPYEIVATLRALNR